MGIKVQLISRWQKRWLSSLIRGAVDEGDWIYSPEWWGTKSRGHQVFRANSSKGNGVISVVAYPSSKPESTQWSSVERWLEHRYAEMYPKCQNGEHFRILGYQWRVLHFNETTRQSAVKVMVACDRSDPTAIYFMQQPYCLPVPYTRSMISVGLATLTSGSYDLVSAVLGTKPMRVLCIGHGGGGLPLFMASSIQGALVDIVEIDPIVISASVQAMGFPAAAVNKMYGEQPCSATQFLWEGIHERIFMHESDAKDFVASDANIYDLVLVDAYDGDDIFPWKLWDPCGTFLESLSSRVHPDHGTVVVNLHAVSDIPTNGNLSACTSALPMGKYVSEVCWAYRDALLKKHAGGLAFVVSVPWLCNASLVVGKGLCLHGHSSSISSVLSSKASLIEQIMNLPFSCLQYIRRGFHML